MSRPNELQRELTRRDLFRRAACAAVSSVAIASTVRDLRLINAAAADGLPAGTPDFKALVCIFLFGGNDSSNLLVQIDDNPNPSPTYGYQAYQNLRGPLTIPKASLLPITPTTGDGHQYAVHPNCPELAALFNAASSNLAFVCNVGPLVYPVTAADYTGKKVVVPPQLFSHNDQVIQWQTSIPDRDSPTGWCGRVADLMNSLNTNATVSMSISVSGINTLEVGNKVNEYTVSTSGPQGLTNISSPGTEGYNLNQKLIDLNNYSLTPASPTTPQNNLYEVAFASTTKRGIDNFGAMNSAISPTASTVWQAPFPNTGLGRQLKMVARMIAGRKTLNHQRQIFFVSVGGYDLHTGQVGVLGDPTNPLVGPHVALLTELSQCINAFQAAINQLRTDPNTSIALGPDDSVVGFTASDFGRTFQGNGTTGSDHGWGNHQIVFGDGVAGGRMYGAFPTYQLKGPDDAVPSGSSGYGRWIPKIAVDEYSATLAKWFGVSPTSLTTVFPNLPHFMNPDLGFMTPPPPGPASPVASSEAIAPASSTSTSSGSKPKKVTKLETVKRPVMRR
jgi:uncharacterized protein (DUF1501 family)